MSASEHGASEHGEAEHGGPERERLGSPADPDGTGLERGLGWLLLLATLAAAACFSVVLVWPPAAAVAGAAGVAVLLGAPFAVILVAGVLYARTRSWGLAAITLLLMAILGAGLWIQAG